MAGARATSRGRGGRRRPRGAGARPATRRREEGGRREGRGEAFAPAACSVCLVWSLWNFWVYFGFFVAGFYELHDVQPGPPGSVSCTNSCDGFVRTGSTSTSQALQFLEESRARRNGARDSCGRCKGNLFKHSRMSGDNRKSVRACPAVGDVAS
jgi:hypothetical protein